MRYKRYEKYKDSGIDWIGEIPEHWKIDRLKKSTDKMIIDERYADYNYSKVVYPPIDEQVKIANYLDQKTSEIDSLIQDKEKLISLLEEKRQAIITETVIKGLNPNVKMKDSGIEWIGKIPEHWEVKPLIYFISKENNIRHTVEGSAKVIKQSHIHWDGIKLEDIELSNKPISLSRKLMKGDLLLNSLGTGTLGRASLFYEDGNFFAGKDIIIIRLNKNLLNEVYAFYLIQSKIYQNFIHSLATGSTDLISLPKKELYTMPIIVPPIAEQKEIANYLQTKDQHFKHIKDNINKQIQILKEYRQSIIFEAVTGKIDLRDYEL